MDQPHIVNMESVPWNPHPTIKGVQSKIFENAASLPLADVLLANVVPGGIIPWHVHPNATETAYVVRGKGRLLWAASEEKRDEGGSAELVPGIALTVPIALWHSVVNDSDEPLILFAFHTPPTF